MNLNEKQIYSIARIVAGENERPPYFTGYQIVKILNECGISANYHRISFRWDYLYNKIEELEPIYITTLLERYLNHFKTEIDQNNAINKVTQFLNLTPYKIVRIKTSYKIANKNGIAFPTFTIEQSLQKFVSAENEKIAELVVETKLNEALVKSVRTSKMLLILLGENKDLLLSNTDIKEMWEQLKKYYPTLSDKLDWVEHLITFYYNFENLITDVERPKKRIAYDPDISKLIINLGSNFQQHILELHFNKENGL